MGGSQRRHGMAHGAVGEHHGSWGAGKCRSTQGRVDGEFSDQERCLRLALPSAGSAVGGRLDRHRADSRRAVAPAERGGARALGASKRHKSRERRARGHRPWPVNHSLETLTASYVSRQTAGKPKGARVHVCQRHPEHPAAQDGHRRRRAVGRRRGGRRIGGVGGVAVAVGHLRLTPQQTWHGGWGKTPQVECRASVLIKSLGNKKNSVDLIIYFGWLIYQSTRDRTTPTTHLTTHTTICHLSAR